MEIILPPAELGTPPPWSFSDGDVMFVFNSKPSGHRCAWSCKWSTKNGVVTSDDWTPVEAMGHDALAAELADLTGRGVDGASMMLARLQEGDTPAGAVLNYVRRQRETYPEFIYPYNPPARVYIQLWRPGWDKAAVMPAMDFLADDPPEPEPPVFSFRRRG